MLILQQQIAQAWIIQPMDKYTSFKMANLLFLSAMKDIPSLVNLFPIVLVVNGAFRHLCASNLDNHAMKKCVCM